MTRSARLWLDTPVEPPFHGSMGIMGHYFRRALTELAYDLECSVLLDQPPALQMVPIPAAEAVARLRTLEREEIRIFFDRCVNQVAPLRSPGITNAVFFHGLRYAPGVFLESDAIAGLCANSEYTRTVLLGLLLYPHLAPRAAGGFDATFAFRSDAIIGSVPLALPALDFPAGYPSVGEPLPSWVGSELAGDSWFGHALRPRKLIPQATAAILHLLNREPLRSRLGKPVRLFIAAGDRAAVVDAAQRLLGRDEVSPHLIPLPWIRNTDLVELMRRTHFGLLVDWFPEPFGLYPLESVFHGSPVYTSGAGNLRHLLPPEHGLCVVEPDIAGHTIDRYGGIAARIADELVSRKGAADCARGRDFMRRTYSAEAFIAGLDAFLKCLEPGAQVQALDPSTLPVEVSPMVRSIDRSAGVLVSDVGELHLPPDRLELMERVIGRPFASLLAELDERDGAAVAALFACGAVSLGGSAPSPCRLRMSA